MDKDWIKARKEWLKQNPPNHQGQWLCALCGKTIMDGDLEVDHIIARSKSRALRLELSNLQPSHRLCNRLKGSRMVDPIVTVSEYKLRKLLDL